MHRKSAYFLFLAVLGMLVIGIVMLFSTSAFARDSHGDVYFFIKRQAVWLGIGLVGLHCRRRWSITISGSAPGGSGSASRSSRWRFVSCRISECASTARAAGSVIGPFTFQPSEIAKVAAVFFLAWWFARYEKASGRLLSRVSSFRSPSSARCSRSSSREVDLGTTALIGATMFVIMFVAGTNPALLGLLSLGGLGGILFVATQHAGTHGPALGLSAIPKRFKQDAGLQQMQALIAWGSGGMEGLGLGNGRQKMLYLPYAHTDFIFPMIGEELGLRVSLLVVFLFVVIIVCGMMIALHAKDRFGLLLGCGIVSLLGLQAAVNIGVTTSLLPNKGLPLPFISYGGSNLAACLFGIGLLLNIYRQGVLEPANKKRVIMQARITPRI